MKHFFQNNTYKARLSFHFPQNHNNEFNIDLFIVSTRNGSNFGQFIFPKSVLHQKGILSDDKKEGKRAIRVYPPWDTTTSKQAQKTQQWQLAYFIPISNEKSIDFDLIKKLIP